MFIGEYVFKFLLFFRDPKEHAHENKVKTWNLRSKIKTANLANTVSAGRITMKTQVAKIK